MNATPNPDVLPRQIDTVEIRGINGKILFAAVGIVATISFTGALAYAGIINSIKQNKDYTDYKFELQQVQIEDVKVNQNEMKVRLATLELMITRMQKQDEATPKP